MLKKAKVTHKPKIANDLGGLGLGQLPTVTAKNPYIHWV
jgi:hypothetical protein